MEGVFDTKKRDINLAKPTGAVLKGGVDLSAVQYKFYDGLLYVARSQLKKNPDTKVFSVPLSELKKLLSDSKNNKHNVYYQAKIEELMRKIAHYGIIGEFKTIKGAFVLISSVKFITDNRTGYTMVEFELPEEMRVSLLDPNSIYANINLAIIKGLKGRYAIILYELVRQYVNFLRKSEIPEITIGEFRELFGLGNKYLRIGDIKKRVLTPAITEINNSEKIDFLVDYELKKQGKAYTHIKFIVKPKPAQLKLAQQVKSLIQDENPEFTELMALIPEIYRDNMSVIRTVLASLKEKGFEYTKAQIVYTNSQRNLKNYPAYLKKAIEENYAELIIKKMEEEQRRLEIQKRLEKFYGKRIVFKKQYVGVLSRDGIIIDGTNSAFTIGDIEEGADEIELFDEYIKEKVIDRVFVYTDKNGVEKQYKVLELDTTPEFLTNKFPAKIQDMDTSEKLGAKISSTLILEIGEGKRDPKELILE